MFLGALYIFFIAFFTYLVAVFVFDYFLIYFTYIVLPIMLISAIVAFIKRPNKKG